MMSNNSCRLPNSYCVLGSHSSVFRVSWNSSHFENEQMDAKELGDLTKVI